MAEPARRSDAGPEPDDPERKADPRAGGWADVRDAMILQARACVLSVAELAARPDDDPALEAARLHLAVLERLAAVARRWVVDEAVIDAERDRAWKAGYAACKAERRRLSVVDGG